MEELKSNAGQGLGIAGLVLGILAIPLGIIPCTFFLGVLFGLSGIVLSIIALVQASRLNGPKAIIIIALVCSILGFSFASTWGILFSKGSILREIVDDIKNQHDFDFQFNRRGNARPPDIDMNMDSINAAIDSNMNQIRALEDTLRRLEHENL